MIKNVLMKYLNNYFFGLDNSIAIIHPYLPINLFESKILSIKLNIGNNKGKINVFLKGTKIKEVKWKYLTFILLKYLAITSKLSTPKI